MATQQPIPQGPLVEPTELQGPTIAQLCSQGAVILTHQNLAEAKGTILSLQTELRVERLRNENLSGRATTAETQLLVLKAQTETSKNRDLKVRLVELVIILLLYYSGEAAKSGELVKLAVLAFLCVILVIVILLIQRSSPSAGD